MSLERNTFCVLTFFFTLHKETMFYSLFKDVPETTEFGYSDRIGSRNRRSMLIVYCKNEILVFNGEDIPTVLAIRSSNFTKDGKWSHTTYDLSLAAGWKFSSLTQDWNNGLFVPDFQSIKRIKNCLELPKDVQRKAVENFLQKELSGTWKRYQEVLQKMERLEEFAEELNADVEPFEFQKQKITNRVGYTRLLINGSLFKGEPMPGVEILSRVSHGRGEESYSMMISTSVEVEEVTENPYPGEDGDDSLTGRGWMFDEDEGDFVPPKFGSDGNTPFEGLSGLFK